MGGPSLGAERRTRLLIVGTDPLDVEQPLAGGELRCPGCAGELRPWGPLARASATLGRRSIAVACQQERDQLLIRRVLAHHPNSRSFKGPRESDTLPSEMLDVHDESESMGPDLDPK